MPQQPDRDDTNIKEVLDLLTNAERLGLGGPGDVKMMREMALFAWWVELWHEQEQSAYTIERLLRHLRDRTKQPWGAQLKK